MNTFNVKDMIEYSTSISCKGNWGIIIGVLEVRDSINSSNKGSLLYKVNPLDPRLCYSIIEEKNIIQAYSKYYDKNDN